ncbi:hypothetical protein L596_028822 [Steinernema carpocapsae]|uniref:Endonuclease/exonuclease/phosphatase domain-containing protein n=1 Tax=Steinernema carpocapsae TaxID=34508 RepID=A0A4U5M0J3_STECR|nr:hypothetical protein L596_028822 [Steinernema carpocapsae]
MTTGLSKLIRRVTGWQALTNLFPKPPKSLRFGVINAQSLRNKTTLLDRLIQLETRNGRDLDILIFTETWLKNEGQVIPIKSGNKRYDLICGVNPNNGLGGGVAIAVGENYDHTLVKNEQVDSHLQVLAVDVKAKKSENVCRVVATYIPPRHADKEDHVETVRARWEYLMTATRGDFNIEGHNLETCYTFKSVEARIQQNLNQFMQDNSLEQHVKEGTDTRTGPNVKYIKDWVIAPQGTAIRNLEVLPPIFSHHKEIFADYHLNQRYFCKAPNITAVKQFCCVHIHHLGFILYLQIPS